MAVTRGTVVTPKTEDSVMTRVASFRTTRWWWIALMVVALGGSAGILEASSAHAQCITDMRGADDEAGQKDLNEFCLVGSCGGSNTQITWNFDDVSWSGNNTGDACALFDTDGDGDANRAVRQSEVLHVRQRQTGSLHEQRVRGLYVDVYGRGECRRPLCRRPEPHRQQVQRDELPYAGRPD